MESEPQTSHKNYIVSTCFDPARFFISFFPHQVNFHSFAPRKRGLRHHHQDLRIAKVSTCVNQLTDVSCSSLFCSLLARTAFWEGTFKNLAWLPRSATYRSVKACCSIAHTNQSPSQRTLKRLEGRNKSSGWSIPSVLTSLPRHKALH